MRRILLSAAAVSVLGTGLIRAYVASTRLPPRTVAMMRAAPIEPTSETPICPPQALRPPTGIRLASQGTMSNCRAP